MEETSSGGPAEAGRRVLQNEVDRARRSGEPFVLALVDVAGHGAIVERDGLQAGAIHLEAVAMAMRSRMRSYDAVVLHGPNMYLCGLANLELSVARRRAADICAAILLAPGTGRIDLGLAALGPTESLNEVIARAGIDRDEQRRARA